MPRKPLGAFAPAIMLAAALLLFGAPSAALAQGVTENTLPSGIYKFGGTIQQAVDPIAIITKDSISGDWCIVGSTATCLMPGGGGGGGGGGAVTVADGGDVAQGAKADAACGTDNGTCTLEAVAKRIAQRLTTINTTLGSPFQAGGSIGNTSFGSTGALGAFVDGWDVTKGAEADAACGTDNGTCTQMALLKRSIQRLTTLITGIGSPFQAGGSIGNSAFSATSTTTSPTVTPTITAGAYSTGNVLGGILSFTSQPNTGAVANANATFDSGSFSAGSVDLYLFNASPTGGGVTDHAAFALTATDTAKVIGVLHLSDCTSLGGVVAQCQVIYQSQFYTLAAAGTTIFAVPVVRGSVTFAGTGDAKFGLQVVK